MNSSFKQLNLDDSLHQFHDHRAERLSRESDETSNIVFRWFADEVKQLVRRVALWISRWRQRRAAIRELQLLNDHYLKDIGLERSQIASALDELPESGGHPAAFTTRRNQRHW